MGVFERFFHISLLLAVMLFAINLSLITFGEALTGEKTFSLGIPTEVNVDLNITSPNILQSAVMPTTSAYNPTGLTQLIDLFGKLVGGYQLALRNIFAGIDASQTCEYVLTFPVGCADTAELAGGMLVTIIMLFQLIGIVYLPFALWGAAFGGGVP